MLKMLSMLMEDVIINRLPQFLDRETSRALTHTCKLFYEHANTQMRQLICNWNLHGPLTYPHIITKLYGQRIDLQHSPQRIFAQIGDDKFIRISFVNCGILLQPEKIQMDDGRGYYLWSPEHTLMPEGIHTILTFIGQVHPDELHSLTLKLLSWLDW